MYICFDTETTGLSAEKDEILELAITDENGNTLFHERFKPKRLTEWPEAQKVHGISPEDVKDCHIIDYYKREIQDIFDKATGYIGYNLSYDIGMLRGPMSDIYISDRKPVIDVMKKFAKIYGEKCYYGYKNKKLTVCAEYYGYQWTDKAHGALADTLATLYCHKAILEQKSRQDIPEQLSM